MLSCEGGQEGGAQAIIDIQLAASKIGHFADGNAAVDEIMSAREDRRATWEADERRTRSWRGRGVGKDDGVDAAIERARREASRTNS